MPRGGRRPGAGRKRKGPGTVLAMPGVVPPKAPGPGGAKPKPPSPPKGVLTRAEYRVWVQLASEAMARGTLTTETRHGFAMLCQLVVRRKALEQRLDQDGWTYVNQFGESKRHTLWGVWQNVTLRVEQQFARFGLIGEGRPPAQTAAPASANPWAAIAPR